ncbi:MAG TPA: LysR family transcriptional regulator [Myxococcaceae bacterium]|nr:LysR family transcriptional regulator [Myxococcaceae bacterium]
MIDLNEMAVFARVVAKGSFTAAARELRVPPSTLSRKVAALEKRLGTRLLERTTRKLRLTDAGSLYFERCERIRQEAEEADASMLALSRAPQGTLRISAPPVWGEVFLASPLAEYARRHGSVQVEVVLSDRVVDLVAEGFDLALRVTQRFEDSSLVMRRLGTSMTLLCASPTYLAEHGTPRSTSELGKHALIGLGAGRAAAYTWRFIEPDGEPLDVPLTPRFRVNTSRFATELCRAGMGIALLPWFMAAPLLEEGTLVRVLPEARTVPREVCLMMPSTRGLSAKVRAFLDVMDRHFGGDTRPWR